MVISIIGLLIGAIFLIKTLLRKYGWSFGKRARKNRIKSNKAISKQRKVFKKKHSKTDKKLEETKNNLKK